MNSIAIFQIGKAGVTDGVIVALNKLLENHKHIRVSLLPSSGRNRDNVKTMADSLVSRLSFPCVYRVIGFTLALRRIQDKKTAASPKIKPLVRKPLVPVRNHGVFRGRGLKRR